MTFPASGLITRLSRGVRAAGMLGAALAVSATLMATLSAAHAAEIKLATTTSTENSGLLKYLLPRFEKSSGVTVKALPDEIDYLLSLPFIKRSVYIGRYGWVSVSITDEESLELALRLVDSTYDQIANKKRPKKKKS